MICHKAFVLVLFSIFLRNTNQQEVMEKDDLFPLTIVHISDFHGSYNHPRVEYCLYCFGYSRIVFQVRGLLNAHKNAVFFNAGDNFSGSKMYDIGRWRVTSSLLNMMPADAMTLGPHEFDHGIEGLVPFLESLRNTRMLVANMDSSREPTMQGKYQKSMIIKKSNRTIGVIGVTTSVEQSKIGNIGNLTFLHEGAVIEEEAANLKSQGVNIIIVISHCGFDVDKVLAEKHGSDIDVIVGTFSNNSLTRIAKLKEPISPNGDYPTVVTHASGHRVLLVQAGKYGQYVGNLKVKFDNDGNIAEYEGAPIYLSKAVPQDFQVNQKLAYWGNIAYNGANAILGDSLQDFKNSDCKYEECPLGNLLCDAMLDEVWDFHSTKNDSLAQVQIAILNYNSFDKLKLRSGAKANKGLILYGPIALGLYYKNTLTAFDLPGKYLLEALELSASTLEGRNVSKSSKFLQVAGLRVTYDLKKPMFQRVIDIQVRRGNFSSPSYERFSENSTYRIVAPNSLIYGSDNFHMISNYTSNEQSYMPLSDALLNYIKKKYLINPVNEGRIEFREQ